MGKDRFKTRASYDYTFKYGIDEYQPSVKRTVTSEQVSLMKKIYYSDKINSWQKNFIKSCLRLDNFSDKQKKVLNNIYKQYNHGNKSVYKV